MTIKISNLNKAFDKSQKERKKKKETVMELRYGAFSKVLILRVGVFAYKTEYEGDPSLV